MSKQQQYALLAKALFYPTTELIDAVEKGLYSEEFGAVPLPGSLEDLEVEYCRLFVGPGHVEVPPYESVYHGHDSTMQQGLVMGPVTMEVKELYYEAGLQLAAEFSDMPDHIAVETLFLAYLEAQLELSADENLLRQKHLFLKNHIGCRLSLPMTGGEDFFLAFYDVNDAY